MSANHQVHLGFEVGTGVSVSLPIRHMVVTGQTQESGKTTTLEAVITRSGLPAIAFLTKRGEASLSGRKILPYFRERADWQFVQSIIESTFKQGQDFKQPWIMRVCEGARSLADVQRRAAKLEEETRNAMSKDMYMVLGEYLRKVVPLISSLPKSDHVDVGDGLAVMDLVRYPEELQMLVIASTLEWIHKNSNGVITVIPEAWKYIPESKKTPVKVVAEKLAREGAGLKNYIWIDSQDIAGVAKLLLRSCAVWLIGVQREANEVKRAISNMPEGMKRPKAGDVATLELGQFFCCHGRELRKVYVQPVWMIPPLAQLVAQGRKRVEDVARMQPAREKETEDDDMWKEKVDELTEQVAALQEENKQLHVQLKRFNITPPAPEKTGTDHIRAVTGKPFDDIEGFMANIAARVIEQIRKDPVLIRLAVEKPAVEITVNRKVVTMDDSTIKGKIAKLLHEGWFAQERNAAETHAEVVRRGMAPKTPQVRSWEALNEFCSLGLLYRNDKQYTAAPDVETRIA